jgi:hypothetical protein
MFFTKNANPPVRDPRTPGNFEVRHSICLFAPYFGKIPGYMPLFLKSCAWNPTIQWFIHSDADWSGYSIPHNVTIVKTTLEAITEHAEKTLGCKVSMPRPYKLCDLRPMYGVLFAELAKGFDFWGHCDLDLVFGDLRAFLPVEALDTDLRLYENGHLSLYRNNEQGCNAFRLSAPEADWRQALADPASHAFDEFGITYIFRAHNFPTFKNFQACASISPQHRDFCMFGEPSVPRPRAFVWRNGKVFCESYDNGKFQREEYAYVHVMRRYMVLAAPDLVESCNNWLIVPNGFIPTGEIPLPEKDLLELNKPSLEHRIRWHMQRLPDYWRRQTYKRAVRKKYGYVEKR